MIAIYQALVIKELPRRLLKHTTFLAYRITTTSCGTLVFAFTAYSGTCSRFDITCDKVLYRTN